MRINLGLRDRFKIGIWTFQLCGVVSRGRFPKIWKAGGAFAWEYFLFCIPSHEPRLHLPASRETSWDDVFFLDERYGLSLRGL
jgi:hypothetical protein